MANKRIELGVVDDILFKTKDSKKKEGHFGLMTNNKLNRKLAYQHGVISALIRFIHPNLFNKK